MVPSSRGRSAECQNAKCVECPECQTGLTLNCTNPSLNPNRNPMPVCHSVCSTCSAFCTLGHSRSILGGLRSLLYELIRISGLAVCVLSWDVPHVKVYDSCLKWSLQQQHNSVCYMMPTNIRLCINNKESLYT